MKSKPTNPTKFEEKIEKELKSLQDSVMNTSEPYIYQEDFDIERKESLRAISTLCEERVKRARVEEINMVQKELGKYMFSSNPQEIAATLIGASSHLMQRLAELKGKE